MNEDEQRFIDRTLLKLVRKLDEAYDRHTYTRLNCGKVTQASRVRALLRENPHIKADEVMLKVGCCRKRALELCRKYRDNAKRIDNNLR